MAEEKRIYGGFPIIIASVTKKGQFEGFITGLDKCDIKQKARDLKLKIADEYMIYSSDNQTGRQDSICHAKSKKV